MHFICRDSPYGVHFNSNSKVYALSGLYPFSFFSVFYLPIITLGNKDFGAWDILTDFSSLGSPHNQMNTHLAQSGQTFPQIRFFKAILEVNGQIL